MVHYNTSITGDTKTFYTMVESFPVLFSHLNADNESFRNGIYALRNKDRATHNRSQFKIEVDHEGRTDEYFVRVEKFGIEGEPAINASRAKYLHVNKNKDNILVMKPSNSLEIFYSIDDQAWLDYREYYTDVLRTYDNKKARLFRVYDVKRLEEDGYIYRYSYVTNQVTCGGKVLATLPEREELNKMYFAARKSLSRIGYLHFETKVSTYVNFGFEGDGVMSRDGTVRGIAAELCKSEPNIKINSMADRIRKRCVAFEEKGILAPVGKINGKDVYVTYKKIDIDAELNKKKEDKEAKRSVAEDRYKMTKKVKTWLVRHDWKGSNKKWTSEETQLAFELVMEHNNK